MNKVELLRLLEEYKNTKEPHSPGIANIVQLVIEIVIEDIENEK